MSESITLIAGLPAIIVIPMMAKNGEAEGEYSTGITRLTLAASLVTLPLISLILL